MKKDWYIEYGRLAQGKKSYGEESILTLSNGYVGWRGAPIFSQYSDDHYPGLYVAGVFNQTKTPLAGQQIVNEDLVNLPNPQLLRIYVEHKEIDYKKIIQRNSRLNLENGREIDEYEFRTDKGSLYLESSKIVDPINFHLLGLEFDIKANFDAEIQVDSIVDTAILNQNVERYRDFHSKEFEVTSIKRKMVVVKTIQSEFEINLFVKTISNEGIEPICANTDRELVERFEFKTESGRSYHFSKVIGVTTSNELEYRPQEVEKQVHDTDLSIVFNQADQFWRQFWQFHDLEVESKNPELQILIRLSIFHLQQAANHNANRDLDASVSSRALTGEGYRGHIFWDEIFFIPFYAKNKPEVAKDLIRYRINRLKAAQENARIDHEKGAMYPWQSGMYGDEQAQLIHLNPVDNSWDPDNSRLQRHVSLAIAYNVWYYYHVTDDESILNDDGALTMILEICKFWLNKATMNDQGRYDIIGVMGPDEFHEKYPDAKLGGFKNNSYTNIMAAWLFDWVGQLARDPKVSFKRISREQGFSDGLVEKAYDVSHKLNLEVKDGIIAQFAGYFNLKELDFSSYEQKYGDIHRIDRILKAEGKSPDDYQLSKQADLLMVIYNLGVEKTQKIINQLGYKLPDNWLESNTKYYLNRTTHGSTTSRPVFAIALSELDLRDEAESYMETAIGSDFYDIQGGTTAEGLHIGVMGESIEVITRCFAGVDFNGENLIVKPHLPTSWTKIHFQTRFKGVLYDFEIKADQIEVTTDRDCQIILCDQIQNVKANKKLCFKL